MATGATLPSAISPTLLRLVRDHNVDAVEKLVRAVSKLRHRPSVVAVSATGSPALSLFTSVRRASLPP